MARTILQIYDSMVAEKETMTTLQSLQPNIDDGQTLLNDLTTASKVAVWRSLFFVMAVAIWTVEKLFDEHVLWINQRATELIIGNVPWYVVKAKEFQFGVNLEFDGTVFKYATANEAAQLVKLASATEIGGEVLLKLAKLDGTTPIPLTVTELNAFQTYMSKVKFAGVRVASVSRPADLLKIQYHVYINPLVMNPDGSLILSPSVFPVHDVINQYVKDLPFDGIFSITELTDLIQQADGVLDPVYDSSEARFGIYPFVPIVDSYNPNAGYLSIDPAFPLSTTITYIIE